MTLITIQLPDIEYLEYKRLGKTPWTRITEHEKRRYEDLEDKFTKIFIKFIREKEK